MKYYTAIVVFLFAFNTSLYLLNALGIYQYALPQENTWISKVLTSAQSEETYQVDTGFLNTIGDIVSSIGKFVAFTAYAMIYPKGVMSYFGFPDIFGNVIQTIISFAYLLAVIEFVSGRIMGRR